MNIFDELYKSYNDNIDTVVGLTREMKAIYIYNLFERNKKSILVVTNSIYDSNILYQSIQTYTDKVLLFPMDDFITSVAIAKSPDLFNTRLEAINKLIYDSNYIVITNLMGYLHYLPNRNDYISSIISLSKDSEYDIKKLTEELVSLGYKKETLALKTGDFAVRGFVIDIYPTMMDNPIRIEYFGDYIDKIKVFDAETQRTINELDSVKIEPNSDLLGNNRTSSIIDYLPDRILIMDEYSNIKNSVLLLN